MLFWDMKENSQSKKDARIFYIYIYPHLREGEHIDFCAFSVGVSVGISVGIGFCVTLVLTISAEPVVGVLPHFHGYIIGT